MAWSPWTLTCWKCKVFKLELLSDKKNRLEWPRVTHLVYEVVRILRIEIDGWITRVLPQKIPYQRKWVHETKSWYRKSTIQLGCVSPCPKIVVSDKESIFSTDQHLHQCETGARSLTEQPERVPFRRIYKIRLSNMFKAWMTELHHTHR
jgi:hypothetical protein